MLIANSQHASLPSKRARSVKADKTSREKLSDIDGYCASPVLSFRPSRLKIGSEGIVRRWETAKRYYEARIEMDMFGTPILLASHGGKGTRLGMIRVVAAGDDQVMEAMKAIERRRQAHGYTLVDSSPS